MLSCRFLAALSVVSAVFDKVPNVESIQTYSTVADVYSDDNRATAGTGVIGKGDANANVGGGVGGASSWLDGDADVDTDSFADTDSDDDFAGGTGIDAGFSGTADVNAGGGVGDATNVDGGVDAGVPSNAVTEDVQVGKTGGAITNVDVGKNSGVSTGGAVTPFPSTGGGASVTASVTDSNGKTQTVSNTINGQPIGTNVVSKFASTGATTDGKAGAIPSTPFPSTGVDASETVTATDSNVSIPKTSKGQTTPPNQGPITPVSSVPQDVAGTSNTPETTLSGSECYAELSSRGVLIILSMLCL